MKKMKFGMLFVLALVLVACGYYQSEVEENEVGLKMGDGVTIDEVVGPGRYSDVFSLYADLKVIDVSAKTSTYTSTDLVTLDKQPMDVEVIVTYSRMRDGDSITEMWRNYRSEAESDDQLETQVLGRVPDVVKEIIARYTLDELLGIADSDEEATQVGRSVVTNLIYEVLELDLEEIYVDLLDVQIINFNPSDAYLTKLEEKALVQIESEISKEKTAQLQEQLLQEEAQTDIDLERARRDNLVNEELAKVYAMSPEFYELEKLKLLSDVLGDNDMVLVVPQGTDLSMILSGLTNGETPENIIPLPPDTQP